MYRLFFYALSISLLLAGCNTQKASLKTDKDVTVRNGEGYLLIGVDTSFQLDAIVLNAPGLSQITLTKGDLQAGSNFILTNLPAGEYTVSRVKVLSNYYFSMKEENWKFTIVPHRINYAGNLKVRSKNWFTQGAYFEMVNESSIALEYLQERFPKLLKTKTLLYAGPGHDDFYDSSMSNSAVQK